MTSSFTRSSTKQIVYVASSVTNATDEYRQFIQRFKRQLQEGSSALVLQWLEKDTQIELDDFFVRNFNNVKMCDVMIAIVDEPSIGLGMEIKSAIDHGKKFLCLHKDSAPVSRLLLSARDSLGIPIRSYQSLNDAVEIASDFIAQHAMSGEEQND